MGQRRNDKGKRKHSETKENKDTACQNLQGTVKTGLAGNLRATSTSIKNDLKSISKLYALRNQKESKQNKPKASRKNEIIKISKDRKTERKLNKMKRWFFEKIKSLS